MSSRLGWFVTQQGRRFVGWITAASSCGIFAVQYFPQTIFLNKYYNLVTMRKLGDPLPLTNHLDDLWASVVEDLNLNELQQFLLKPFMVFGFDVWRAGSLCSRYGAIIGLPVNFTYENLNTIDKDAIVVKNEPVNWKRQDAQQLLSSFILSDEAKKYAIAREILMTNNNYLVIQSITSALLFGGCYSIAANINDSMNLWQKPRVLRISFYTLLATFFWGLWAMQKDTLIRMYEAEVDEHLSQLGESYIRGGYEFYDKLLNRNIALRSLMGKAGEAAITLKGNENFLLRQKRLPIMYRKQFFEDKLKNIKELTHDKIVPKISTVA